MNPTPAARILCTLASILLGSVGALAIMSQSHTGYARYIGQVTLSGERAVLMGITIIVLALLPMVVWVPKRWVVMFLALWWLAVMVSIFGGLFSLR